MNIKKIAAIVVLVGTALNFSQQTKASDKIDCNALLPIKGIHRRNAIFAQIENFLPITHIGCLIQPVHLAL